jgi:16S rRNA processing protein RimM
VPDRTAAEVLVRGILFVPESMSPPLPEGSWWDHQLVGCRVEVEGGRSLGELRDVIHTPANDVWSVVDAEDAETLIPVLRDVIASVDVKAKAIVVRAVPGLTVPEG